MEGIRMEECDLFGEDDFEGFEGLDSMSGNGFYDKSGEPKELTLINAMEWLTETSKRTKLCAEYLEDASRVINFVAEKFQLTPRQSVLLSLFSAKTSGEDSCCVGEVAHHLGCSNFDVLAFREEVKTLEKRQLIMRVKTYGNTKFYSVTEEVIEALTNNRGLAPIKCEGLSYDEFFQFLYRIVKRATESNFQPDCDSVVADIKKLIDGNPELDFVKSFNQAPVLDKYDFLLFMFCVNNLVNWDNEELMIQQCGLDDVIGDSYQFSRFRHSIMNGTDWLVSEGLIEMTCKSGFGGDSVKLTSKAVRQYLNDYEQPSFSSKRQLLPEKIVEKQLFYNKEEEMQIARLASVLDTKNYHDVCMRLKNAGMRKGICVLLSGGPGTGKTESVLQLARQSGRAIIQVNVNDIMDKFVGESEKRAVSAFNYYRQAVKKSKVTPILFFNECDQLFSRRLENVRDSVDQMRNSLQNIFLQQLETLEGILICTTNLVQNLDPAFERRFLFKIEFQNPSKEVRYGIWKNMLPSLTDDEAMQLSASFDFSGGQIENITRKALIEMALTGVEKPTMEQYLSYCNQERFEGSKRNRIGF